MYDFEISSFERCTIKFLKKEDFGNKSWGFVRVEKTDDAIKFCNVTA